MEDLTSTKRARELASGSTSSTSTTPPSEGQIHPTRQHLLRQATSELELEGGDVTGKSSTEEEGKAPGKKAKSSHRGSPTNQGTLSFSSSPTRATNLFAQHPSTPSPATPAAASPSSMQPRHMDPVQVATMQENIKLQAQVATLMKQVTQVAPLMELVAQLQMQVKELQELKEPASASPTVSATMPPAPSPLAPPPAIPAHAAPAPAKAPPQPAVAPPSAASVPTGAAGSKTKKSALLRQRAVEPSEALLQAASLPSVSATDLVISVQYAPHSVGFMRRRVFFPNHVTSPKDTCIAVGSALQDPASLQIAPPRIPSFLMKANGLASGSLAPLMDSLHSSSKEYLYLEALQRVNDCGDDFDLQSHHFPDAECVQGWSSLLTSSTQAYKPTLGGAPIVEARNVVIRLGFAHPLLMEAARRTFADHAERIQESGMPTPSRSTSPSPSVASTMSDSSSSSNAPASPPPSDASRRAPLSRCALHSTVTVTPLQNRFVCTSVSNWPREHPTELCGGNGQLDAFVRLHAPDLRVLTTEQYGSTSPNTTVICQQQHLSQLLNLRGMMSPEHGISTPLNLHCDVQIMGAQTCTFCWSPGHGANRCPHRASASNPVAPTSHLPACRFCYSFAHHASACRVITPVTCKLCEVQGHATHACPLFKPSKRALADFLKPRTAAAPHNAQTQAAPILSAAQRTSERAWQGNSLAATPLPLPYVTPEQLQQALTPIALALQELMLRFTPLLALTASMPTSARPTPVFSSPSLLNGQ
jgi:hypothetical protein